ncbi:MAG: HAMP domain-containing sensor histidine kinase [Chloroflexota bacterium]|nr:HAMP domain-containing sensor histidine kinase [Chloroflexota bacterium]
MENLLKILQQHGKERELAPGEVLIRQGSVSDGVYYLKQGWLGVYREERGNSYLLSVIAPGEMVGELGASTGRSRTATVMAAEESCVIHISEDDFRRAMNEVPNLAAEIIGTVGHRLTDADIVRVTLGRSYRRALDRAQTLRTQKAQLEELLRLREELVAMIIHDLRNPLGAISTGLGLLKRVTIAEPEAEYMTMVMATMGQSVRRMQRLVDALLDIARLEEGAMTLWLQSLDLGNLITEVITEELPLAEKREVVLESHLPESLSTVLADRDVLQRVLINLLDNALKFTPKGGHVWVEAQPCAETVQIKVIDTGPGIPSEERVRIFEKFTQVRGQVGERRGSGLGLTFCQMAVEAHGGSIWVEDGPEGDGSCFVFTLPKSQEATES